MSKLTKIREMLQKALVQLARITTDKGVLSFEGDELEIGAIVAIVDEEGNESAAEDGEYKTEDGKIYVIADGKVTEIREEEPAEEVAEEVAASAEIPAAKEKFNRMKAAFEASYEEKEMKIAEAIRATGIEAWLIEAGDDFAVVEVWDEDAEDYHYERFAISWDEEGNVIVGESQEVKSEFVPVDAESPFEEPKAEEGEEPKEEVAASAEPEELAVEEEPAEEEDKDEKIVNLEAEVARLETENGELKERIKELEAQGYKISRPNNDNELGKFQDLIVTGEFNVCLLDPWLYETVKKQGGFARLEDALGYTPDSAVDEYAIKLSDTEFGKYFAGVNSLPEDTYLCIRTPGALQSMFGAKSEKFDQAVALVKAIVEFKAPETK